MLAVALSLTFTFAGKVSESNKTRSEKRNIDESLYALGNEIKYNLTFNYVKNILKDKNLVMEYSNDFIERLSNNEIILKSSVGESTDKVVVKRLQDNNIDEDKEILINIKINYRDMEEEITINKAYWMDYCG